MIRTHLELSLELLRALNQARLDPSSTEALLIDRESQLDDHDLRLGYIRPMFAFCESCGDVYPKELERCPDCGQHRPARPRKEPHDPR